MIEEQVILVDKNDNQIGLMPKMEAHEKAYYIERFRFLPLMKKDNYYYNKELQINTIRLCFGRTLVVHINEMEKLL